MRGVGAEASRTGHYGDDLAYIHARGFTALAEAAADEIRQLLGEPRGPVVDLGCGNGVTTRALVAAGHDVIAVDSSPAMLEPGGLFAFDLAGPGRIPGSEPVRGWSEGDDWAILVEAIEDRAGAVLTRRMTTFRQVDGAWRRGHETHRQRLHRPLAVAGRLRDLGLRVRIRQGWRGTRFAPGHFVVMANQGARNRV